MFQLVVSVKELGGNLCELREDISRANGQSFPGITEEWLASRVTTALVVICCGETAK